METVGELTDDPEILNADTDEDNNVVIKKKSVAKNKTQLKKKKMKTKKKKRTNHLLGDLIEFGDVDDFFPLADDNYDEVMTDNPSTSNKSNTASKQKSKKVRDRVRREAVAATTTTTTTTEDEQKSENDNEEVNEDEDDFEVLGDELNEDEDEETSSEAGSVDDNLIDDETKTEAFRHIIAGACMSIGLKFAGSFNNEAYKTLVSEN
jgi:hypothetical protein